MVVVRAERAPMACRLKDTALDVERKEMTAKRQRAVALDSDTDCHSSWNHRKR